MLSTTAEYALRIMVALVETKGAPTTSEKIAAHTSVPADYAVKVLQMLARANLVRAQRGRGGGFRLACPPESTTLLDVVNAIDTNERKTACPIGRELVDGRLCSLHRHLDDIAGLVETRLGQVTIQNVADDATAPALCPTVMPTVTIPRPIDVPHRSVPSSSGPTSRTTSGTSEKSV